MQKLIILTALGLILLVYTASAESKELLYGDAIISGGQVSIDNTTFTVYVVNEDKAVISINDSGIVLVKGNCEKRGLFEVCFNGANVSYQNANKKDVYSAKVQIYGFLANIEINRTVTETSIHVGEESSISTIIKNTGEVEATGILYTEEIPEGLKLVTLSGCDNLLDNLLIINTELESGESKTCNYTVTTLANRSYTPKANISYFNGKEIKVLNAPEIKIVVLGPYLGLDINISKEVPQLNEEFDFRITLTNTDINYSINVVSFEIEIPNGIKVTNLPDKLKSDYLKYSWSGILEKTTAISFKLELMLEKFGSYNLVPKLSYIINNKRIDYSTTKGIVLKSPEAEINITQNATRNITSPENITNSTANQSIGGNISMNNTVIQLNPNITLQNSQNLSNASRSVIKNNMSKLPVITPPIKDTLKSKTALIVGLTIGGIVGTLSLVILPIIISRRRKRKEVQDIINNAKNKLAKEMIDEYQIRDKVPPQKRFIDEHRKSII